jgi:hypothetical protein
MFSISQKLLIFLTEIYMSHMKKTFLLSAAILTLAITTKAQRPNQDSLVKESAKTEVWEPVPKAGYTGN